MNTAVATRMSADEFLRIHGDESHVELVRGEVVREPMPKPKHGRVNALVTYYFMNVAEFQLKLGRALNTDTFIRTGPTSIRGMDFCFVSYQRLPAHIEIEGDVIAVSPDVVVEVLSPSNRPGAMQQKIDDYLGVGVAVVVVFDPELEIASIYRPNELPIRLHNGDTFELPEVLPGFSIPLKSFFT